MMHNTILNSKRYSTPLGTMFNKVARIIYVSITTRFAAFTYPSLFQTNLLVEPQTTLP